MTPPPPRHTKTGSKGRMPASSALADAGAGAAPPLSGPAAEPDALPGPARKVPATAAPPAPPADTEKKEVPALKPPPAPASSSCQSGHRARLRKRFVESPTSLPDYELLELLLGHVILRKDTKPMAKAMLKQFGTFRGVMNAQPEELAEVPGFGPGVAAFWQLLQEVLARYAESPVHEKVRLGSPDEVAHMARQRLGALKHEEVWCAFVNSGNRLVSWQCVARGTVDESPLYPRDIMTLALKCRAAGFVLVHNHPGGSCTPSGADMALTRQIAQAASGLGIQFMDHVIVTEDQTCSLRREGLMEDLE